MSLGAARQRGGDRHLDVVAGALDRVDGVGARPGWALLRGRDRAVFPGVPDRTHCCDELGGAFVARRVVQVAATPEVGAGPGVVRGDRVPARATAGQQVEPAELARQVGGLVVGRVLGGDQADVAGDPRQRGQLGDGVGAARDVEFQDGAVLFAQAQSFAEEERVEQSALGGLRELAEGLEIDLRAAGRVGPDRGVVHALEEDAEMDLGVRAREVGHGKGLLVISVWWRSG